MQYDRTRLERVAKQPNAAQPRVLGPKYHCDQQNNGARQPRVGSVTHKNLDAFFSTDIPQATQVASNVKHGF